MPPKTLAQYFSTSALWGRSHPQESTRRFRYIRHGMYILTAGPADPALCYTSVIQLSDSMRHDCPFHSRGRRAVPRPTAPPWKVDVQGDGPSFHRDLHQRPSLPVDDAASLGAARLRLLACHPLSSTSASSICFCSGASLSIYAFASIFARNLGQLWSMLPRGLSNLGGL